jgi:hypothetical protein
MVAGLRSIAKAMELPPEPNVRAPALDPTRERPGVKLPRPTRHFIRAEKRSDLSRPYVLNFGACD